MPCAITHCTLAGSDHHQHIPSVFDMNQKSSEKPTTRLPAWANSTFAAFAEQTGGRKFRRSDLAKFVADSNKTFFRGIRPNSPSATRIAEDLIHDAVKQGTVIKAGHVHWALAKRQEKRTLHSGRVLSCVPEPKLLQITTRCPDKFLLVDLETGEAWHGSQTTRIVTNADSRVGWTRAKHHVIGEARSILDGLAQNAD